MRYLKEVDRMDVCGFATVVSLVVSVISFIIAFAVTKDTLILRAAMYTDIAIVVLGTISISIAYHMEIRDIEKEYKDKRGW